MDYAIIAAGNGSRLSQEGIPVPKPLVKLNGVEMISRLIHIFLKNKASSINIIVNEEMVQVHDFLEKLKIDIPLNVVIKSTPSSMHSFYELKNFMCEGKFCLTTVDTVFNEKDFYHFVEAFISADSSVDGMMAVTDFIDDEKPLYVEVDNKMYIKGFHDLPGSCKYISGGIYGLTTKAINTLEACLMQGQSRMRNFQRELIKEKFMLKAYTFPKIIDVDHAGDINKAETLLNEWRKLDNWLNKTE